MEREQIEAAEAAEAAEVAAEEARRDAQEAARESGAASLDLELGDEITLPAAEGDGPQPKVPDPPAPAGEQTAAEGLAEQMEKASGTVYVLFAHGVVLDASSLEKLPEAHEAITVKALGGNEDTLEPLLPIGFGRYTGAPAALLACRERFGEGEYAAIPLRNITVKAWKQEQVPRWV